MQPWGAWTCYTALCDTSDWYCSMPLRMLTQLPRHDAKVAEPFRLCHQTRPTHGGTGQGTGRIDFARPVHAMLSLTTQHRAFIVAEALRHRMYGAAARR